MNSEKNILAHCLKCKTKFPDDRGGLCPKCYKEIFDHKKYRCKKCGLINIEQKKCYFCLTLEKNKVNHESQGNKSRRSFTYFLSGSWGG